MSIPFASHPLQYLLYCYDSYFLCCNFVEFIYYFVNYSFALLFNSILVESLGVFYL